MENFEGIRLPWPDWKIVRYIGGGGYGKVYEIERNIVGILEKAAVKIIARPKDESELEDYYDNGYDRETAVISFESELRSYAKEYQLMKELQGQSNIVSCDDVALVPNANGIGGKIFLRMELLTSLQQVLRERSLSEKEIIKLGKDISHALMLCESKKIIHRDIKPQNILLSQFGDYKLGDFGVSKIMDHATYATMQGTLVYQAPEVVHLEKYGHSADVYSLGITLYWLLNNRKMPFINAEGRLTPQVKEEAYKRRYRGEQLPAPKNGSAELKLIVLKACAYRPKDRYASAEELHQALEGIGNGKAETVKSDSTVTGKTTVDSLANCWEEAAQTVGVYKTAAAGTAQKTTYGYEEEQTGGESWGTTAGTIGATVKAIKEQTPPASGQEEENTIGTKQAYQQKKFEVKPERKAKMPEKKKNRAGILWIVAVIVVAGVFVYNQAIGEQQTYTEVEYYDEDKKQIKQVTEYYDEEKQIIKKMSVYDSDGNIQHEGEADSKGIPQEWRAYSYDEDGNLICTLINEFDEEGKNIKNISYNANDEVEYYYIYEYDEEGKNIKNISYNANDEVEYYYIYEYDEEGKKIKDTKYNANDEVEYYYIHEYDEEGKRLDTIMYDAEGNRIDS